jgi:putative ABC transport system permease protein
MSTHKRPDDDFAREIRAHIDLETDRLIEDGVPADAARAQAQRRFGNVTRARERYYEAGRFVWLDHLANDLRCAVRNTRRYPIASLVAILSLAAGIGATTVSLMVRDVLFYRPPVGYHQPGQLSRIQVGSLQNPIRPGTNGVPVPLYTAWRDTTDLPIAAWSGIGDRNVRAGSRTHVFRVRAVTPELFAVLGVRPSLGRSFADAGPDTDAPPVILSQRAWFELFDRRDDAIGQVLWIADKPHTVIGVMPQRFWFSDMDSPIWSVLDLRTLARDATVGVVVRRPETMTPAMLEAQLQGGLAEYAQQLPAERRQMAVRAAGFQGTPVANQMSFILPYVLGIAVLLTLIIACANVAVLMIAQWTAREHEIAIRASIGASRGRIVRGLLTESIVVAACGGVLGICVTLALRGVILRQGGDTGFFDLAIDFRIFFQAAAITLLTGAAAGIAPALYETRRLQTNPLRTLATSDRVRQRWRHSLVVLEVAVTTALLVVTATMVSAYWRAQNGDMGYSTTPLLTVRVDNDAGVPSRPIAELLANLPGVVSASASTTVPFGGPRPFRPASAAAEGGVTVAAELGEIDARFFETMGIAIRAGRAFSVSDSSAGRTAIVNESLARQVFADRQAVGARVWLAGVAHDVIGVVADYSSNPLRADTPEPRVFLPLAPDSADVKRMHFVVRSAVDPATLVRAVREETTKVAPGTVVASAQPVDQILLIIGQEMLVGTAPLVPLVTIGLMLTMAGIYGVLAFAIARKSRELAVRIAVGATASDVVRLVTGHTLRLLTFGAAAGLLAMFGLARLVRAGGGAGTVWDPGVGSFVVPVLLLLVVGAIASWIPSRRALAIDPVVLLRTP